MPPPDATAAHVRPVVRPACLADLPALTFVDSRCFPEGIAYPRAEIAALLRSRFVRIAVAALSRDIVGFAALGAPPSLRSNERQGELITIDVLPEFRRQRVGRQLYLALEEQFRAEKGARIELHVAVDNEAAQRFYQSLGFRTVGRTAGYYLGTIDAWRMEKLL
ncbi:MAG: GNAT family N-acetyltransferase [Acidobacteriaceae bacterium]